MSEHVACLYRNQPRRHASRRGWLAPALALIPLLALLLAGCGTQAGDWRLISPAGVHIYSVATDPNVHTAVYAGGENGAVYRARADHSGLAVPGEGIPADAVVASLLPDPKVPGRIFAGTSAGLYRSEHYGDTWGAFGAGLPSGIAALALASTPDDSVMLAGMDGRGVYRSADDGAMWTPASNGLPAKATVTALTWDSANKWWWLGLQGSTDHSIYTSSDGGQSWQPADGLIRAGASVNALATLAPAQPGYTDSVFAATSAGVYFTTGSPQGWRKLSDGLPSGAAQAVTAINGKPGGIAVAIGAGVYASTDYGVSWTPVAQGLSEPAQGLAVATDGHGAPVYFVASSQLARYPTGIVASSNDSVRFLLIVLIVGMLLVGGYAITRRLRRFGYAMGARDNELTAGPAAAASRTWERQQSGVSTGAPPAPPPSVSAAQGEASERATSRVLSPSDLTTREQTGAPAKPDKAAQNGHGDPKRRS